VQYASEPRGGSGQLARPPSHTGEGFTWGKLWFDQRSKRAHLLLGVWGELRILWFRPAVKILVAWDGPQERNVVSERLFDGLGDWRRRDLSGTDDALRNE